MFTPGRITDIDAHKTLTPAEVARVEASMDAHAVTILPGQDIDDAQQLAFSRNFGTLEIANADIRRDEDRRLAPEVADVSNLGKNNDIMSRDDRRRLFAPEALQG